MSLLIAATVFIASYKFANFQDKTNKQKHEEYKKELIKMYDLKKLKLKMKHRQQFNKIK